MLEIEIPVYNEKAEVEKIKKISLWQFIIRRDLIHKLIHTYISNIKQVQGRSRRAGLKSVVHPQRKKSARARTRKQRSGIAMEAPGTRGGRLAHRPRSEKVITKKQNKKEKILSYSNMLALLFSDKKIIVLTKKALAEEKIYDLTRKISNTRVKEIILSEKELSEVEDSNKRKKLLSFEEALVINYFLNTFGQKQLTVISEETFSKIKEKYLI